MARMGTPNERRLRIVGATLMAATFLQGCASMESLNVLAAIDGPFVPASERQQAASEARASEAPVQPALQEAAPAPALTPPPPTLAAAPVPEPEVAPAIASVEPRFIGPVLPPEELQPPAALPVDEELGAALVLPEAAPLAAPVAEAETPTQVVTQAAEQPALAAPVAPAEPEPAEPELSQPIVAETADDLQPATAEALPETALLGFGDLNEPQYRAATPAAQMAARPQIGPDFLPPDFFEDAGGTAVAAPASPLPASPSTAFIGPVLEEDEEMAAAELPSALPSAFDFVTPAPDDVRPQPQLAAADAIVDLPASALEDSGLINAAEPLPAEETEQPELPALAETNVDLPASEAPMAPAQDAPALAVLPEAPEVVTPALAAPAPESSLAAPEPSLPPAQETQESQLAQAAEALGLSVVSAMPGPGGGVAETPVPQAASPAAIAAPPSVTTSRGSAYQGFYDFALAKLDGGNVASGRQSMLLLDPPSLDPELQLCGNLPPAVLIDLDPANGLLPLVSSNRPNPELAGYLAVLRQRGVTVFWISGHAPNAAARIRTRLTESALDPSGNDPLIVTRFAGESKQARRYALGESNCLLAILGDHRGDFDELYDFVLDPIMAGPLEIHVDRGWFIAPPPLN